MVHDETYLLLYCYLKYIDLCINGSCFPEIRALMHAGIAN